MFPYDPDREPIQGLQCHVWTTTLEEQAGQKVRRIIPAWRFRKTTRTQTDWTPDVVTLALEGDIWGNLPLVIDQIRIKVFRWQCSIYTSTIVFLVRKGNPKQIQRLGWSAKSDVIVITRIEDFRRGEMELSYSVVLFWKSGREWREEITEHMKTLYQNVLVVDSGARGSTTIIHWKWSGWCLIAWERMSIFIHAGKSRGIWDRCSIGIGTLSADRGSAMNEVVDRRTAQRLCESHQIMYSDESAAETCGRKLLPSGESRYCKEFYTEEGGTREIAEIPSDGKMNGDGCWSGRYQSFLGWNTVLEKAFLEWRDLPLQSMNVTNNDEGQDSYEKVKINRVIDPGFGVDLGSP